MSLSRSGFLAAAGAAAAVRAVGARPGSAAPAAGRPVSGGRAVWALTPGFPPTVILPFTPPSAFGIANLYEFQTLMYRPLYWFGKDGQPGVDYALSCAEPPRWSADGLTATVTVKPWKWSDGTTVDADAVMFWMHLFEVNKARHGGYVPGYFPDNLRGYRKVAPDQVSFTFAEAYSRNWVLMNQLSLIQPLPKAWDRTAAGPADATHDKTAAEAVYAYLWQQNLDRASFATNPLWQVVNGPWKLAAYAPDGHARFVPNGRYSGPNKPYLAEFAMVPNASDDAEYALLGAGPGGPGGITVGYLPFDRITEPTADPTKGGPHPLGAQYALVPQIVYGTRYFPLNFNNPTAGKIFRQLYFRQALQSLVDQDWAIREVYKGYGYRTDGPVPLLPDSDAISPAERKNLYPFSIATAQRLLREHGWDLSTTPATCTDPARAGAGIAKGDRLRFALDYAQGHPALTRMMDKLAADAARAGIELRLTQRSGGEIGAEAVPCRPGPATPCTWQLASWNGGWTYGPGYAPTGEFQFETGAAVNWGSYSDPRADALIARTVRDDAPSDLYAYEDYIAEQLPFIWLPNFPLRLLAVAHGLHGVEPLNPYCALMPENWYYAE